MSITKTTKIKVSEYYGIPSYLSVMPRAIFDALEASCMNGEEFAQVDEEQFKTMMSDYKEKMGE